MSIFIASCEKIDSGIEPVSNEILKTAYEEAADSLYKFQNIETPQPVAEDEFLVEISNVRYYYSTDELYERVSSSCCIDDLGLDLETFSTLMDVVYSNEYHTLMSRMLVHSLTRAKGRFEEYTFKYKSIDAEGNPIILSGVTLLPNYATDGKFKHTLDALTLSHDHLKGLNDYVSKVGTMEFLRIIFNQVVVLSDFEGYNVSRDHIHPYLCYNELARQSIDCAQAALELLNHVGVKMKRGYKTYNMGMSKGSPVAIAAHRMIETTEPAEVKAKFDIAGTYSATGPYDLKAMIEYNNDKYLKGDSTPDQDFQICYVAATAIYCAYISHKEVFDKIGISFNDFFSDDYIPDNFDIKAKYNGSTSLVDILQHELSVFQNNHGSVSLNSILNEDFFVKDGERIGEFNYDNILTKTLFSVLDEENPTLGWRPKSPILFEHSYDDEFTDYDLSYQTFYDMKYSNSLIPNINIYFNTYYSLDHNTMSGLGIVRMSMLKNPAEPVLYNIFK